MNVAAERMTICQVLASRGDGGLEKHFIELCGALAERHDVVAIADASYQPRLTAKVRMVPMNLTASRWNPLTIRRLRAALRDSGCNIVHAQANKAATLVARASSRLDVVRVATIHNVKRQTSMFRGYDHVIAVSPMAAAAVTHPRKIVILNGCNPPPPISDAQLAELRQTLQLNDQSPTVCAIGRLVPAKGFDILLQAWQDVQAQLIIVGDGPQRAMLAQMIRDLNLANRVRLLGHRNDVPAVLAASDLVVISSRHEGFPYVMIESLHARRPIVGTRMGGAEFILPASFLAPVEDAGALRQRVLAALADLPGARQAYEPVWAKAANELTLEAMTQRHEAVYRELLAGQ